MKERREKENFLEETCEDSKIQGRHQTRALGGRGIPPHPVPSSPQCTVGKCRKGRSLWQQAERVAGRDQGTGINQWTADSRVVHSQRVPGGDRQVSDAVLRAGRRRCNLHSCHTHPAGRSLKHASHHATQGQEGGVDEQPVGEGCSRCPHY